MSESSSPCIYCPACGADHPWLAFLKGQEFQCACGHVLHMPDTPPTTSSAGTRKANADTGSTFSLDALVNTGSSSAASPDDLDDSDELEVVEENESDVVETADEADSQMTPDDELYELASIEPVTPKRKAPVMDDLLSSIQEPTAKTPSSAPTVAQASTTRPGMSRCKYCDKDYPYRLNSCPHCGCDELGRKVDVKKDKGKKKDTEDVKLYFMGIACTPVTISIGVILFLSVIGTIYWFFTGPFAKFRYYDTRIVHAEVLLNANVQGQGALIDRMRSGTENVTGATRAGSPTNDDDKGYLAAGSEFPIYAIRPDPQGNCLVLDVGIQQNFLENHNAVNGYDVVFDGSSYNLKSDTQTIPATILLESFDHTLTMALSNSKSSDFTTTYPTKLIPEKISWDEYRNYPAKGTATFTGTQGMTGSIDFYLISKAIKMPGVTGGMDIKGTLNYVSPTGTQAVFDYQSEVMQLTVDHRATLWREVLAEKVRAKWSPYSQFRISLFFPRPPKGRYQLYFGNEKLMNVNVP